MTIIVWFCSPGRPTKIRINNFYDASKCSQWNMKTLRKKGYILICDSERCTSFGKWMAQLWTWVEKGKIIFIASCFNSFLCKTINRNVLWALSFLSIPWHGLVFLKKIISFALSFQVTDCLKIAKLLYKWENETFRHSNIIRWLLYHVSTY